MKRLLKGCAAVTSTVLKAQKRKIRRTSLFQASSQTNKKAQGNRIPLSEVLGSLVH